MESNKRYTQTVEKPFHISQAAMDTSTGDSEPCQVMVVVDGKNFLICTLQKSRTIQVPLDLYFKTGTVVSFLTNGKCNVHLTGYLDPEYDDEEESEDEEEEAPELVPAKNKRKLDSSTESATKKLKQDTKKQLKQQLNVSQDSEDDSSDSDDEGNDLQKLLDGDVDSDENDESFRPNSTGADSEEGSGEEEEEGEEEAEAEEEESPEEADADTSKEEEPKQLSKAQKRREKKKRQQQQKQKELPQTNGVEKKKKEPQPEQIKKQKGEKQQSESPEKRDKAGKQLSGGVHIEELKVGSGPEAKPGKQVEVYYEGRLKSSNKMFDHCKKGPGFRFRIGQKEVISGWDVGVAGMKVGGKRKIVCPPNMAYGAKGSPPVIPPNSTLVFEVELRKVK